MNKADVILSGNMTLKELTELIESNMQLAAYFRLRLSVKNAGRQRVAYIHDGETVMFRKVYSHKYQHYNTALMHADFEKQLKQIKFDRTLKPHMSEKLLAYAQMTERERRFYDDNNGIQERKDYALLRQKAYDEEMRRKAADEDYGA